MNGQYCNGTTCSRKKVLVAIICYAPWVGWSRKAFEVNIFSSFMKPVPGQYEITEGQCKEYKPSPSHIYAKWHDEQTQASRHRLGTFQEAVSWKHT
jgi:hypothetical protein